MLSKLNIHESWNDIFVPLLSSDTGQELLLQLGDKYHPTKESIFRAFSIPKEDVCLIIIGQDVYPDKRLATGLAFGVPPGKDSVSLKNIRTEIYRDFHDDPTSDIFLMKEDEFNFLFDNSLEYWQEQGVLLLNSALTCGGTPGDHWDIWQPFMSLLVTQLPDVPTVLFGTKAATLKAFIKNPIIAPHPASDSYGGVRKFYGCGVFREIQEKIPDFKWIEYLSISSLMEDTTGDLPF